MHHFNSFIIYKWALPTNLVWSTPDVVSYEVYVQCKWVVSLVQGVTHVKEIPQNWFDFGLY